MTLAGASVGFIGLGLMGLPMARNLLNAGANLTVFNRTASKADPLVAAGAHAARNVGDVAERALSGLIIICVHDTPAFAATIEALTERELHGTLVIDMGTSAVDAARSAARAIAAVGGTFVDAPVSGGELGAQTGALSIMAGGARQDIDRAMPAFMAIGKSVTHIGPVGAGQVAKAANQAIVGVTLSIVAEALLLAEKAGADKARVRAALLGGFANSRVLDLHGLRMVDSTFDPGARATTQLKDMTQAAELAGQLGLDLPALNACRDHWAEMVDMGLGGLDQSGFIEFRRRANEEPK